MKKEILDIQEKTIGYSTTELRILLNPCKRDENVLLEKITRDDSTVKKLYESAKLSFKETKMLKVVSKHRKLETFECFVCLSSYDSCVMLHLDCDHFFCKECVKETIKQIVYNRLQVTL